MDARTADGIGGAAECLRAFVHGEDSIDADVGSLLVAEFLLIVRTVCKKA